MSHTNSTANFGLPQFITTDKPAWLTDVNVAYNAIDTAMKNNQDAALLAKNTADSAQSDATSAISAASTADAKGAGAVASLADAFDATSTYAKGTLVIYNSLLYICTTAVTTPGAWTGTTNWSRVTVENMFENMTASSIKYESGSNDTIHDEIEGKQATLTTEVGTITPNTANGWTVSGWCKKINNIVCFYIDANKSSALATGWNTIATLPLGYRPELGFDFDMIDPGSDFAAEGKVLPDGEIQVYKNDHSTTRIRGAITFII